MRYLLIVCAMLMLVALVLSQQGDLKIAAMQSKMKKGEMLKEHVEELTNMQDGIEDCHGTYKKLFAKISPVNEQLQKVAVARDAAQNILTQKNSDLQAYKKVKTAYVTSMNKAMAVADRELELIQKLRTHVKKLSDKNKGEKNKIIPLLDSIEARIKAEKRALQDGLDKHNQNVAARLAEKNEAVTFVKQEQDKVDEVANIKSSLEKSATNQKKECNRQTNTRSVRKKNINNEMKMISNAYKKTSVPNSNKLFQEAAFSADGKIKTLDGLTYQIPSSASGNYVLLRTWDNMIQLQVRISKGRPVGIAVKSAGFQASVEESMDIFMNGGKRSAPTYWRKNEIFTHFVTGGTQYIIQLADGTRISITKIGNLRSVVISAVRDTFWKNSAGLFGVYDNDQGNDMIKSNHVIITANRINAATILQFVDSWKATGTDLFMQKFVGYPTIKFSSTAPLNAKQKTYMATLNRATKSSQKCGATGDPHYTTYDGHYYHMVRAGDYIFTEHISKTFSVQVRTVGYPAGHEAVAVYSSGDVMEFWGKGRRWELNGKRIYPGRNGIKMTSGTMIYQKGNLGEVVDPRGIRVTFNTNARNYIAVYVYLTNPKFSFNKMYGLCGNSDRNGNNDLVYNGKTIAIDKQSRWNWGGEKVWGTEYKQDSRHTLFNMPFTPHKTSGVRQWKNDQEKKKAEAACKKGGLSDTDFESCVDDIQATGDFKLVEVSKAAKKNYVDAKHRFLDAKPVLSYPLKDMRANRAVDISGSGKDGVFYGDMEVLKGALDFRGGRCEVRSPGAGVTGKEMSASLWLNLKSTKSGSNIISVKNSWSVKSYTNGGRYALKFTAGNTELQKVVFSYNKWYYVTVTYETGEAASMYVNGKVQEFVTKSVQVPASTSPLEIGGPGLVGRMNGVLLYDFALELEQVHGLYHIGDDIFSSALSKTLIAKKKIMADKVEAVKKKQNNHQTCLGVQKQVQTAMDAQTANVNKITNNVKLLQAQTNEASNNKVAATKAVATLKGNIKTHTAQCVASQKLAEMRGTIEREIALIKEILVKFKAMKKSSEKGGAEYLLEKLMKKLYAELKKVDKADAIVAACPQKKSDMKANMVGLVKADASTGQKLKDQEKLLKQEIEIQTVAQKAADAVDSQLTEQTRKCKGLKQATAATVRSYDAQIGTLQQKINKIVTLRKNSS